MAKRAARDNRVPPQVRSSHAARCVLVQRFAMHIGRMTFAANHADRPPYRDSDPVPRRERQAADKRAHVVRPPSIGGHMAVPHADGDWGCFTCWKRADTSDRLASVRCEGDVLLRWAARDDRLLAAGRADAATHTLQMIGNLVWCTACGAYSADRAVGIVASCRGRPPRNGDWGRHTKLARLLRGLHPKTGHPLQACSWKIPPGLLRDADRRVQVGLRDRIRAELGLPSISGKCVHW